MVYIIIIILVFAIIKTLFPKEDSHVLNIYFGVPGSGKTTVAAYLFRQADKESRIIKWCKKHKRKKIPRMIMKSGFFKRKLDVFSNVPITGAFELNPNEDIGIHHIENAKIIIDEAGIEYNNRNFKSFPPEAIYFYKYHRHYKTSVEVFSQSYDDMDITLKRLAQNYYVVKKSLIPFMILIKPIKRKIGIDEKHNIADLYFFGVPILSYKWIYAPACWKLFNSYSRKELTKYDFPKW